MRKTLADELLQILPETLEGISFDNAIKRLGATRPYVRAAFEALDKDGRATMIKRGKGAALFLVRSELPVLSCKVCRREYERATRSKRLTCSRKCHGSLGWGDAESSKKRRASISAAHSTPKALARTAAHNQRRWANPEQHERLKEQNRERARLRRQDPEAFERYRAMLRLLNGSPEKKKMYSELRKQWWRDPVMRKKMTDAVNASDAVKKYRRNFGAHARARWQDPRLREKYLAANRKRNTSAKMRAIVSASMKKRWLDPAFREKMIAAAKNKETRKRGAQTRLKRAALAQVTA